MALLKTLILVKSVHHQNTEAVARAIAGVLQADVCSPDDVDPHVLPQYELVGFGSGVYFGRLHSSLVDWIKRSQVSPTPLPAFIFSTAGMACLKRLWHWSLRKELSRRGFEVVGEFSCRGYDTVGPLRFVGGLNRGHPDTDDLSQAAGFAEKLLERLGQRSTSPP